MANTPNLTRAIGDKISTTITGSISASDTTITVATGSGMNANGGYVIIDPNTASEEIVYIESVSGNTLTVATDGRGRGATTATSHTSGAVLTDIITNEMFNRPRTTLASEHNDDGTHKTEATVFNRFVNNGRMMDGVFNASVASNNLTVTVTCLDGTTPSTTRPVRVVIGNTLRTITGALSMTLNAGTDWFNMSALGSGTQTYDLFVLAVYDSVGAVVRLGLARAYRGIAYSDYSTTSTSASHIAISGGTPAASDRVVVIGRLNVSVTGTNFATAGGSISEVDETALVRTYTPTVSASGSMSVSGTTVNYAKYQITGQMCTVSSSVTFTTGGTASNEVYITLPFSAVVALDIVVGSALGLNTGTAQPNLLCYVGSSNVNRVVIIKGDGASFNLGSVTLRLSITYPIA